MERKNARKRKTYWKICIQRILDNNIDSHANTVFKTILKII